MMPMLSDFVTRGALLDAIADTVPIIVADLSTGEIVYATRPAEELFGYFVHGILVGKSVDLLIPEDLRAKHAEHRAAYAKHPMTRPMGAGLNLLGAKADGSTFPVEIILSAAMVSQRPCAIAVVLSMIGRRNGPEMK